MSKKVYLTTNDNPYDPETEFALWYLFDKRNNYDCCDYLARIARTSDQLSDEENEIIIENAIDEIIKYDFRNVYKKVVKQS